MSLARKYARIQAALRARSVDEAEPADTALRRARLREYLARKSPPGRPPAEDARRCAVRIYWAHLTAQARLNPFQWGRMIGRDDHDAARVTKFCARLRAGQVAEPHSGNQSFFERAERCFPGTIDWAPPLALTEVLALWNPYGWRFEQAESVSHRVEQGFADRGLAGDVALRRAMHPEFLVPLLQSPDSYIRQLAIAAHLLWRFPPYWSTGGAPSLVELRHWIVDALNAEPLRSEAPALLQMIDCRVLDHAHAQDAREAYSVLSRRDSFERVWHLGRASK